MHALWRLTASRVLRARRKLSRRTRAGSDGRFQGRTILVAGRPAELLARDVVATRIGMPLPSTTGKTCR